MNRTKQLSRFSHLMEAKAVISDMYMIGECDVVTPYLRRHNSALARLILKSIIENSGFDMCDKSKREHPLYRHINIVNEADVEYYHRGDGVTALKRAKLFLADPEVIKMKYDFRLVENHLIPLVTDMMVFLNDYAAIDELKPKQVYFKRHRNSKGFLPRYIYKPANDYDYITSNPCDYYFGEIVDTPLAAREILAKYKIPSDYKIPMTA